MESIKKYRIVISTILLISLVFWGSDMIHISEEWSLIIRGVNIVLLIAVAGWILVSPTKPREK